MQEMDNSALEDIGLAGSEIKVYLALLKLGPAQRGQIIKEARIAPSKIYHVTNKLIDKGLVSLIIKNSVKFFAAASPIRIRDYIEQKKLDLISKEKNFENFLPKLMSLHQKSETQPRVEVFIGWKGMHTVYSSIISDVQKNDTVFVFGAGLSGDINRTERFYTNMSISLFKKGPRVKVIFDKSSRDYVRRVEKRQGMTYVKRFLSYDTPSEVFMHKNKVLIVMRKMEPLVILIQDKETADSFRSYFNELWKIAKE